MYDKTVTMTLIFKLDMYCSPAHSSCAVAFSNFNSKGVESTTESFKWGHSIGDLACKLFPMMVPFLTLRDNEFTLQNFLRGNLYL